LYKNWLNNDKSKNKKLTEESLKKIYGEITNKVGRYKEQKLFYKPDVRHALAKEIIDLMKQL
jgi:hypothetical protein